MPIERLLEQLDQLKRTGRWRWRARCPAHEDKRPSLSIREERDGRVLVHCFGGCSVEEVVHALGLDLSDLFPEKAIGHRLRAIPKTLYLGDVVRALGFELSVAWVILADVAAGREIAPADRERAGVARERIARSMNAIDHACP